MREILPGGIKTDTGPQDRCHGLRGQKTKFGGSLPLNAPCGYGLSGPRKLLDPEPDYRVGGPGANLLEGPYDVIHDVIICQSYVFADSQGSHLFFSGSRECAYSNAHTVSCEEKFSPPLEKCFGHNLKLLDKVQKM